MTENLTAWTGVLMVNVAPEGDPEELRHLRLQEMLTQDDATNQSLRMVDCVGGA